MRLTAIFVLLTAVVATSVVARETNGQRLARGLTPNPPVRRAASGTDTAEHHHPSEKPHNHGDGDDDGHGDKHHDGYGDKHDGHGDKHDDGHGDKKHDVHGDKHDDDDHGDKHGATRTHETNAQRLARGLTPNPPVRRAASGTDSAEHHHPSEKPHEGDGDGDEDHDGDGDGDRKCKTGAVQCCNSVSNSANPVVKTIAHLVHAKLPAPYVPIGLSCSPIGEHTCSKKTVCCENNNFDGIIAIGCDSINISA